MPLHTHQDPQEMHPLVHLKVDGLDLGEDHRVKGVAVVVATVSLAEEVESERGDSLPGHVGGSWRALLFCSNT